MIEAFANHLSSHLGRHLFYWAITTPTPRGLDGVHYGLNLRLSELINKLHGPLERGVKVLDHLLTLEEDDFSGHWGSAYAHNYEPESQLPDSENEEQPPAEEHLPRSYNMETLNNGNGLLHSPPHNHQQQPQQRGAAITSPGISSVGGATDHNIQITQPISAPSSPLASPSTLTCGNSGNSNSTTFCLPSSSTDIATIASIAAVAGGTTNATTSTSNSGSGSYVCAAGSNASYAAVGASNAIDTADPNWQASKATVLERNAAMFNNELLSDVRFIVGGDFDFDPNQTIPAHKYILATGSSVFYAMFYGGLAENKEEIKVPDVEPTAFLTLLRYLYCDEIKLEPEHILATLYAAKKYIVPHLARACVNYLEVKLTAKNACLLLSQSRLFEESELMQRCWEVIDAQAEMAVKSEDFVDIDLKTFESILSRETLNCKEIHLFEAALNWAINACEKMSIDETSQNKRRVLGHALHLIRIPTMSLEEFANGVAQTGILTSQETIDMFLHFTAKEKPSLSFPTRIRAGLKTQVCHRFQSCAYRSNQWRYRGRCDSIQFSVDRRIFIVGFGLYGSSTGAANYNVKIELKRLGRTLAENDTKFFSDGSSNTFHVFFENPIQIEPECYYTASVILDGNELSFFGQEGMSEVLMGNVTFQFQCSSESTNGTGVQGGQIPELIFYGPTTVVTALNSPTNSVSAAIAGSTQAISNGSGVSSDIGSSSNTNNGSDEMLLMNNAPTSNSDGSNT
ncbi:BTB/POZ domain-containing protein 6-B [Drosophila albomicans]|uniref:BTB/POZ domain-containing protein 6-B n=1 Tax=Drosophila albomicans TaxID=7291 RepID=A0A6P8ZEH7_DROAB|nr:BTB/POZ domain-containing protein 6-B [Drosophila albomicans]XP_034116422.1 BTB/POZ domain-containing protein 6-B [Drosophila albomicans]